MPRRMRTRPVGLAQARTYAGKADEYAAAAAAELEAGRPVAATSLAVHAAISAADAVCGARLGHRAAGTDHDQVLAPLGEAGADGTEGGRYLRRLLSLKPKAEYEPTGITISVAARAVEGAGRCAAVARRAVASVSGGEPGGASRAPAHRRVVPSRESPARLSRRARKASKGATRGPIPSRGIGVSPDGRVVPGGLGCG